MTINLEHPFLYQCQDLDFLLDTTKLSVFIKRLVKLGGSQDPDFYDPLKYMGDGDHKVQVPNLYSGVRVCEDVKRAQTILTYGIIFRLLLFNQLSGEIPSELSKLSKLQRL